LDYKTLLLSAKGRVNRKAYWLSTVGILLALAVAWGIAGASMAMASSEDGGMSALGMVVLAAACLVSLIALWSFIALAFKRCHDRDMSGWMMLIPLYNIWVSIQMYFMPGTPGPNRFGADPLGTLSTRFATA
jgi:uncharacterized membrane protein YhaH (DUF805 family)